MDSYWERFNFQGSTSNGINGWQFHLNVGVEFKNLPPEKYWSGFPNTHWTTRAESLVKNSPVTWMYDIYTNGVVLSQKLVGVIKVSSQVIANDIEKIREDVLIKIAKRHT